MKRILLLAFTVASLSLWAQQVSDHALVVVPAKFKDFKEANQYSLNQLLAKSLTGKQYQVISDVQQSADPCSALTADVADKSSIFKTKIELNFTDCHGKIIESIAMSSELKDYEKGFQEALQTALRQIPLSNPKKSSETKAGAGAVAATTVAPVPGRANLSYIYNAEEYRKKEDGSGNFSLVRVKDGQPYGRFFITSRTGVYLVKLNTEQATVAFEEGEYLTIDAPASLGKQLVKFQMKR